MSYPLGGQILGDQASQVQSIFEAIKTDLIEEYGNIQTSNGYRNNVAQSIGAIRHPDIITSFPEIGTHVGPRNIPTSITAAFAPNCHAFIHGVVSCNTDSGDASVALRNATGSLLHDMKRVMAKVYRGHANATGKRWEIEEGTVKFVSTIDTGDKPNRGYVRFEFDIQALPLDKSFGAQP